MHGNEFITEAVSVTLPEAPKPHVGDYIDYQPDTVTTSYPLYGKYSGYGVTTSNPVGTDQEISQDTLNWQILKIYEDGSMDIIGSPTNSRVYFGGVLGYNNGVYLMHDICKKLYSKPSQGIEARSISLEDFEDEDLVKEGAKWKEKRDTSIYNRVQYGHTKTYTGAYSYYPELYARENGSGIGVKIESTDTEEQIKAKLKQDGIGASNKYYTSPTEETYSPKEAPFVENSLTVTQTSYSISINETNYGEKCKVLGQLGSQNWVASRSVYCSDGWADYGLLYANPELNCFGLFFSDNTSDKYNYRLRPVVTLPSSAQLELTEAGKTNSAIYPHKIIKY